MNLIFVGIISLAMACNTPVSHQNVKNADSTEMTDDTLIATTPIPPTADTTTLGGIWYLQPVLPSDTGAGNSPTLNISVSERTFTGNTGCNRMRGTFELTDTSIVFNQNMITTKMACPGYNENAFIKSLFRVNKYKFDQGVLVLMFETTELSRWTRKLEKPSRINKT